MALLVWVFSFMFFSFILFYGEKFIPSSLLEKLSHIEKIESFYKKMNKERQSIKRDGSEN